MTPDQLNSWAIAYLINFWHQLPSLIALDWVCWSVILYCRGHLLSAWFMRRYRKSVVYEGSV